MRFPNITEKGALDMCHILVAVDDYETHHIKRVLVIFHNVVKVNVQLSGTNEQEIIITVCLHA